MSVWRKVFLRNGLIWTAYLCAWMIPLGVFQQSGWPFGLSDQVNKVLTFTILIPTWVAMNGGGMCVFRGMVNWISSEAARKGNKMPKMRQRWIWSFFLEVDEEFRLRP